MNLPQSRSRLVLSLILFLGTLAVVLFARATGGVLNPQIEYSLPVACGAYLCFNIVGLATGRKRLRREAEREVIYEIIKGITGTDDLKQLLQLTHRSIGRVLNADNCFVALYDQEKDLLEMQFFVDERDAAPGPFPVGNGLTGFVFRTGRPTLLWADEIRQLIKLGGVQVNGTIPAVWLGVPLSARNEIIGVLVLQHYSDKNAYNTQDLELLTTVGDQIALAIARKLAEEALRTSDEQHRLLFRHNPQAAFIYDLETLRFLAINDAALEQYGYSRDEALERLTMMDIRPAEDLPGFLERVSRVSAEKDTILAPSRHQRKNGTTIDVEITSHSMTFAGRPAEIVLVNDVTERKAAEREAEQLNDEIRRQRERLSSILENIPCMIWEMPIDPKAPDAPKPFVNSFVEKMSGYTIDEWLSTPDFWFSTLHPEDVEKRNRDHDTLFKKGEVVSRTRWLTKSREVIWAETRMALVKDKDGKDIGVRGVTTDITEQKSLEGQLTHQALHDPLTSLPNRVLFGDRVRHAMNRARRSQSPVAVMFIDLDNFKSVNDTLGHAAGDELLVAVTERLKACLRTSDTPARLGGDEFAVLVEDTEHTDGAVLIAERIRTVLSEPYEIAGKEVFIGTSIGIATTTATGETPEELLRNADVAMYRSKSSGKNRYTVYRSEMHESIIKRVKIESDLRFALERGEFEVFYQPIVDLRSERIIGMEALARWNHSSQGLIPPIDFIPIAEETGLIVQIGAWVLEQACTQARRWQGGREDGELYISVNISSRQFQEGDLGETVRNALGRSGLEPNSLVLEITESTMLTDTEATIEKLQKLKGLGVRLAVDDFGTGYSSLSYLQRFPVDILKIDKSFVDQIANGREGAAVAKAIITMGDTLSLNTIAEGIEYGMQSVELQHLGCTTGQGYHFAKPLPAKEMESLLRTAALGEQVPIVNTRTDHSSLNAGA